MVPLRRDLALRLKESMPELSFTINGEISGVQQAAEMIEEHQWAGAMIGRAVQAAPFEVLRTADSEFYGEEREPRDHWEVLREYRQYCLQTAEEDWTAGLRAAQPLLLLWKGRGIGKRWAAALDQGLVTLRSKKGTRGPQPGPEQLRQVIASVERQFLN